MSGVIERYRPQVAGRITATGTVTGDSHNLTCTKGGTGIYNFVFPTPLNASNYPVLVTLATSGGAPVQGNTSVDFGSMSENGVTVYVTDSTGTLIDSRLCIVIP